MRTFIVFALLAAMCCLPQAKAQSQGDDYMGQARESLSAKEYIRARYLFLQAFGKFARTQDYEKAVDCGVNASALYHRENYYKEAFEVLRDAEAAIASGEQAGGKAMPALRYPISKERLQMYIKMRNPSKAREQLARMADYADKSGVDSLKNDLLYAEADYSYSFGLDAQGDRAISQLVSNYNAEKDYGRVRQCFQKLIGTALRAGNAALVARTGQRYMAWNDSVNALMAAGELKALQDKYDESLATIDRKDSTISTKQYFIIGLCVLAAVLAAALVLGAVVLLRFVMLTRKQKKAIQTANEHNELKTRFIENISAQLEPTLATLDATQPAVQALRLFSAHIQELARLEDTLAEPCEMEERNIASFCDGIVDKVRDRAREGVSLTVNAPRLNVKISPVLLERLLLHLLENAVAHTPEGGKVWIDFKKRGAHTHQFIVSDTGCGIPPELHDNLFKPFSEVRDLTQGDGLGLPICSLIATKMNGTLTLDTTYTKGARFVLELHA